MTPLPVTAPVMHRPDAGQKLWQSVVVTAIRDSVMPLPMHPGAKPPRPEGKPARYMKDRTPEWVAWVTWHDRRTSYDAAATIQRNARVWLLHDHSDFPL